MCNTQHTRPAAAARSRGALQQSSRAPARQQRQHAAVHCKHPLRSPRSSFLLLLNPPPLPIGELPSGLDKLSFVWERGAKVFATEAEPVNPHTRACFWSQYLKQTITVYQEGGGFAPKEYVFKVQAVRHRGRGQSEERRTVGKARVDLAQFCSTETEPLPKEVYLQLK
jgi:hypothetical protein